MRDEDKQIWQKFIQEVKPLNKDKTKFTKKNKENLLKTSLHNKSNLETSNYLTENDFSSYESDNLVDKHIIKKLRRGQIRIESKLDLHGFKYKEAKERVLYFIESSSNEGKRLLLIITGKGQRLGIESGWKGQGVLKSSLPQWLSHKVLREKISWFCNAPANLGGEGAYVIYLRKIKE